MIPRSELAHRRRRVALLLAEGLSVNEIAKALKLAWSLVDADVKAIQAAPNNVDYLSPKRALGRLLDAYDALEREARQHLQLAVDSGKLDAANRWFESVRRITEDRGRVLQQMGILNRATAEAASEESSPAEDAVSSKAKKLLARIALAEKLGHPWEADVRIEDSTAIDPVPDADFVPEHEPPAIPASEEE